MLSTTGWQPTTNPRQRWSPPTSSFLNPPLLKWKSPLDRYFCLPLDLSPPGGWGYNKEKYVLAWCKDTLWGRKKPWEATSSLTFLTGLAFYSCHYLSSSDPATWGLEIQYLGWSHNLWIFILQSTNIPFVAIINCKRIVQTKQTANSKLRNSVILGRSDNTSDSTSDSR